MKARKLFNVILKIFGIFFLKEVIDSIPQVLYSAFSLFTVPDAEGVVLTLILSVLILAFYCFLVLQLIFKTNTFIDFLKLDKGLVTNEAENDKINIDVPLNTILTIALIVIGGVILINEIPSFCRQVYVYSYQRGYKFNPDKPDLSYMITSGAKILIALLIIGERKNIIGLIDRKQETEIEEEEDAETLAVELQGTEEKEA